MNQQPIMQPQKPAVSKWLLIVLIIVILAAGAFAAWYFVMGPGKKITATTTTSPTKTTTEWKTYKNTKYNFQIDYPSTWTTEEKTENDFRVDFTSPEMKKSIEKNIPDAIPEISLAITNNGSKSLEAFLESRKAAGVSYQSQVETKIDNQKAYKTTSAGLVGNIEYNWTKDNINYFELITFFDGTDNNIFKYMAESFKFTSASSLSSGTTSTAKYVTTASAPVTGGLAFGFSVKTQEEWKKYIENDFSWHNLLYR